MLSKQNWKSIEETLYLVQTGTMEIVREREQDSSGFINVDDINWDKL